MLNGVRLFVVSFHMSTSYSFYFNPSSSIFISNPTLSSYKSAGQYEEDISMERQKIPANLYAKPGRGVRICKEQR